MELARPRLTRWTAQLVDRGQERRFRDYNLLAQRRTAVVSLCVILLANAATFGYTLINTIGTGSEQTPTAARIVTQVVGTGVGIALAIGLARERRHTWLMWWISSAVVMMTALVAGVLATGLDMGFRSAILVIGGVAVVYVVVPLHLTAVTASALLYSAATVPLWFMATGSESDVDIAYTAVAIVVVHVLSFAEARRAQGERRVLFAQREMLLALSSVDPLTGLMNRRAVDAELARAFGYWQRSGAPLAVLMVDVDHFKNLNDTQGHIAGDHALRLVADVIRSAMPLVPGQVAARYGGEEFICLLPGLGAAEAAVVAGQILGGVRRFGIPLTATEGGRTILTVSAGVAAAHLSMSGPEALVDAADQQLYRAKDGGRNCLRAEPAGLTA